VRADATIGPHRDLDTGIDGTAERIGVNVEDLVRFKNLLFHHVHARLCCADHSSGSKQRRNEPRTGGQHHVDRFVIKEDPMLDGSHPAANRGLDAVRCLSVRHNVKPSGTRFGDKHLKFVVAKMTVAWIVALREHSTRCRDLDDIRAFAHEFAHTLTNLIRSVDQPTRIPGIRLLPYQAPAAWQVTVTMPTRLAEHRDRDLKAWPDNQPLLHCLLHAKICARRFAGRCDSDPERPLKVAHRFEVSERPRTTHPESSRRRSSLRSPPGRLGLSRRRRRTTSPRQGDTPGREPRLGAGATHQPVRCGRLISCHTRATSAQLLASRAGMGDHRPTLQKGL
jgi:hypothetical protein